MPVEGQKPVAIWRPRPAQISPHLRLSQGFCGDVELQLTCGQIVSSRGILVRL